MRLPLDPLKTLPIACKLLYLVVAVYLVITACAVPPQKKSAFNHITCMDTIPDKVKGLKVLSGPRTEKSIIRDMVPVVCYMHGLYHRMNAQGEVVEAGKAVFKVTVEYTGEVYGSEVEATTIKSERFLRRITDLIMDNDFVGWSLDSPDTVFLYPMSFGP